MALTGAPPPYPGDPEPWPGRPYAAAYPQPVRPRSVPVLPLAPARGWREADVWRRGFAVLLLPLLLTVAALTYLAPSTQEHGELVELVLLGLSVLLGPPACYSAARVLRPHLPDGSRAERAARHWCAAIGTALSVPVLLLMLPLPGLQPGVGLLTAFLAGIPAAFLCLVSLVWGVVAVLVRAVGARGAR